MPYAGIRYEVENGVATITKTNSGTNYAMDKEITLEVTRALREASEDDNVRAVVITSEGVHQGAYVVVQVMDERGGLDPLQIKELIRLGHDTARLIETMQKPVIGVVKTEGVGGGIEYFHACDFVIAADTAILCSPEVETGTMCAWGGSQRIPRIVGWRLAQRILLLGEKLTGKEAAQKGLVTKSVPLEQVDEEVAALCEKIKSLPAQSIAVTKAAMHKAWEMDLLAGLEYEIETSSLLLAEGLFKQIIDAVMAGKEPEHKPFRHLLRGEEFR